MIIKKTFSEWDKNHRRKLYYATFGRDDGLMCQCTLNAPNTLTYVSFNEKQIKGWLIVGKLSNQNAMMIYTNKRYRNTGVGSLLVTYAVNDLNTTKFLSFPHDYKSNLFWKKMSSQFDGITLTSANSFEYSNILNGTQPTTIVDLWREF